MVKAQGIANEAIFDDIFSKARPVGTTVKMTPAIDAAFKDFFARSSKQGRACSILVITAGEPADLRTTIECLVQAANAAKDNQKLTVSFFQVGQGVDYVTSLAMAVNGRTKNCILDTKCLSGTGLQEYVRSYYAMWPEYTAKPAFHLPVISLTVPEMGVVRARSQSPGVSPRPGSGTNLTSPRPASQGPVLSPRIDALIAKHTETATLSCAFLDALQHQEEKDYVILLDSSESMQGGAWVDAQNVISSLAPLIVDLDSDGVALYLFSTTMVKAQGIANEAIFDDIFSKARPVGTTVKMTPAIDAAFKDFFARSSKQGRACSILVITAGEPADLRTTIECLVQAANAAKDNQKLTVSFFQVGQGVDYVTSLAMAVNGRTKNCILDTKCLSGTTLQDFVRLYYNMWPEYAAKPAFHVQPVWT
mmetsp:Transcript_88486/g.153591  ORF Transcript_88486/g.153591 Transcript_88486/m.153591 type:complete len:420 (-) Transcript_88486:1024-2283(-)